MNTEEYICQNPHHIENKMSMFFEIWEMKNS